MERFDGRYSKFDSDPPFVSVVESVSAQPAMCKTGHDVAGSIPVGVDPILP